MMKAAAVLDELVADPVSAWPLSGGLNKTWEQIQRTPTFEKHSKRASLLFSDVSGMSTSILGSLSTALLASGGNTSSSSPSSQSNDYHSDGRLRRKSPDARPSVSPATVQQQRLSQVSLLDEDEEEGGSSTLSVPIKPWSSPASSSSAILKPTAPTPLSRRTTGKVSVDDDDDWNW